MGLQVLGVTAGDRLVSLGWEGAEPDSRRGMGSPPFPPGHQAPGRPRVSDHQGFQSLPEVATWEKKEVAGDRVGMVSVAQCPPHE